jgi:transposase
MKRMHIIPLDTHCKFTEFGVMTESGRLTRRGHCPTTIPDLVEVLQAVPGPRHVVFEEGPLADWLVRHLTPHADQVVACDPRRNHLIAKDSDKDDPIDVEKLGHLYRGGFIRPVHHSGSLERSIFKQHVALYHDRVRQRVRQANRILAQARAYGVFVREADLADTDRRKTLLQRLPQHQLMRRDWRMLLEGYDLAAGHVERMNKMLVRAARDHEPIRRFAELPGVKWIRASTFFAYIDTPWRFKSKSALWKYMGIGLQRRHSGSGPEIVRVPPSVEVSRPLKSMILGAAKTAIKTGNNPFADQYKRWLNEGITPRNARRNVARSQSAVMWGMWKNGSAYRPEWVGMAAAVRSDWTPSRSGG